MIRLTCMIGKSWSSEVFIALDAKCHFRERKITHGSESLLQLQFAEQNYPRKQISITVAIRRAKLLMGANLFYSCYSQILSDTLCEPEFIVPFINVGEDCSSLGFSRLSQ